MTCMGHYEIHSPIYDNCIEKKIQTYKCFFIYNMLKLDILCIYTKLSM